MARTLSDLLGSIPDAAGRSEVLDLGRRVHATGRLERNAENALAEQHLMQEMAERIRWHFRAARYALPDPGELRRMIDEHFG